MKNGIALTLLGMFGTAVFCTAVRANVVKSLPDVFLSVLAEVKAKTRVPVLLPSELPKPFNDAKHASAGASADDYAVSLYYELGAGDAGFAASFGASGHLRFSPRELGNVRKVKLANGIAGFFRPVSCGGSCAPSNLWWEEGAVLYQIQLKLRSTLHEKDQQRVIMAVANSAILGGPR
jgi:hypothetical protein